MPFEILVSEEALLDLENILDYLDRHWPENVSASFLEAYETRLHLLSQMPWMYPASEKKPGLRKCLISKHNVLFYQIIEEREIVEILAVKDTRSDVS